MRRNGTTNDFFTNPPFASEVPGLADYNKREAITLAPETA
jgi:hypothetical protein